MGFFDSFTGKAQAKQIKKSSAEAMGYLDTAGTAARGDITAGADKAYGYLDPYAASGGQANALLGNFLGINGADAQTQAFSGFQNDPGWLASQQAGIGALDRSAAGRGNIYSGAHMKGLYDYGQKNMLGAYNDRINALSGMSGQGANAAGAAAGVASNTGNALGNLTFGLGQQKASNAINKGNALAQTSGMGWQNALNLAGTAAKAFAASDIRVKRDIERIGEMPSGLPVYRFKYIWGDEEHIGVMAQEAMEHFPEAVAEFNGILHVDYGRIG